jgi:hypothetical protein
MVAAGRQVDDLLWLSSDFGGAFLMGKATTASALAT